MSIGSPASRACPYCGETILAAALKCKHCGEFVDGRRERRIGTIDSPKVSGGKAVLIAIAVGMAFFAYCLTRNAQSSYPAPVRFGDFVIVVVGSLLVVGPLAYTFLRWRAKAKRNAS